MGGAPMCGQTWLAAASSCAAMWGAMMLPSIAPTLWRCKDRGRAALVGTGFFLVWAALGLVVFSLRDPAAWVLRSHSFRPAAPWMLASTVLLGGVYQASACKARALAHCRAIVTCAGPAWLRGARLGLHCCISCAGLTAILLAAGAMDWRAMTLMTAAVFAERWAPAGDRVARIVGAIAVGSAMSLAAHAA